ncbi:MAG: hypothetical protein UW99_C0018G0001, partial [Candidatus Collierbacteria bacterium GW2011_GWC2_45_15]
KLGGPGSVSYMRNLNPLPTISLSEEDENKVGALLSALEDNDDVVEVWSNLV